ncbi:MAG: hypothetical protein DHS20C15_25180 [Planctomycetota bacterium]|nr:MAG: hypothetical protein DHS20C15_25180 [Planctomycetota bacterium]
MAVVLSPVERPAEGPELSSLLELAEQHSGPALIVLTQHPEDLDAHAEIVDDFLPTDCDPALLARKLRFAIARRESLRQLDDKCSQLLQASLTDFKTGLPNDRQFSDRCREECSRAERADQPLAVLMIDVDHFGQLNKEFLHDFGDQALREIAAVLRSCLRPTDIAARRGGDEFAVLLPATPLREASEIAQRLRSRVAAHTVEHQGKSCQLSISVGVASWDPRDGGRFENTLKGADLAMQQAKRQGRDRVGVHSAPMPPTTEATSATVSPSE